MFLASDFKNSNRGVGNNRKKKQSDKEEDCAIDRVYLSANTDDIVKKIAKKSDALIKQIIRIKPVGTQK